MLLPDKSPRLRLSCGGRHREKRMPLQMRYARVRLPTNVALQCGDAECDAACDLNHGKASRHRVDTDTSSCQGDSLLRSALRPADMAFM